MSTRKSLVFSFLDRYSGLVITVVSSMAIARLLTPSEIGVYSVTMVLMMFASTVRDLGAGQYLVQEKELTVERIRAVWAVQLGLGLGLALLVVLASFPVALFYNEPRMRDIMLVVALNYAINPFGSLTHAWLMREMRFESTAVIRFAGGLSGALASTWLAWKNFGPISLALGLLVSTVVGAVFAIHFRPKFFPWIPGVSEIRRVLQFGGQLTASSIVGVLSSGSPELLIGKLQNLTAAGLYSRSSGLVMMFHRLIVDAVSAVCLPWFASLSREKSDLVAPYVKATAYVTALGWSFCIVVICLAHPIIRALYGTQWDQSVDLARLLAIAAAFSVPAALCQAVLLSSGGVTVIAKVTVIGAIQTILLVAMGATLGLNAVGMALIVSALVNSLLWQRATARHVGLPARVLTGSMRQSALVAALSGLGPLLSLWVYGPYTDLLLMPLLVGAGGCAVGFVVGVELFKHPLTEELHRVKEIVFKW
jgi:O-antigen/teichoic acid export membrane protein